MIVRNLFLVKAKKLILITLIENQHILGEMVNMEKKKESQLCPLF